MLDDLNLDERSPSTDDVERRRCQALSLAIEHHNVSLIPARDEIVGATAEYFLAFITTGKCPARNGGASLHPFVAAGNGEKRQ